MRPVSGFSQTPALPLFGRHADRDRSGLDADLELLDLVAVAAVELVEHLLGKRDADLLRPRHLHERRLRARAERGPRERPRPVGEAVRGHDAELEHAVVGLRVVEEVDTAEDPADVADEHARRDVVEPGRAVNLDLRPDRRGAELLRAGPEVRDAADGVLQPAVRLLQHLRVEPGACHDGEVLAVDRADVERPPGVAQSDRDGLFDVLGDLEMGCEQVGRSGGRDRERHAGPGEHVDAPLHRAVAAPRDHELGALAQRALDHLRRLAALRHLVPERIRDPGLLERAPERQEAVAERLAGVRDDRDLHDRASRALTTARVMRAAPSAITKRARIPTTTPPSASSGWCMPR